MSASGQSTTAAANNKKVLATIDNIQVQSHAGWLDLKQLINRGGDNNRIHTAPQIGIPTVINNHQRYLMYRAEGILYTPKGPKIHHYRVIAPTGPDGRTYIQSGAKYNLVGFTDSKLAMIRRLEAYSVDEADEGKQSTSPAKKQQGGNAIDDNEFPSRDVSPTRHPQGSPTPFYTGKRSYVRRTIAPRKDTAYQVFLKLFMASNAGQRPTFRDGAEVWRTLSKEQQAQYAGIDSSSSQSSEMPALRVDLTSTSRPSPAGESNQAEVAVPETDTSPSQPSSRRPKRTRTSTNEVGAEVNTHSNEMEISPLVLALDSETQKRSRKERK